MLLAKVFLILFVCLIVRNNPGGSSLSPNFFFFNVNIVPVLFFAASFHLFNCLSVSFTLAS